MTCMNKNHDEICDGKIRSWKINVLFTDRTICQVFIGTEKFVRVGP